MRARHAYPEDSPFRAAPERPLLNRAIPVSEHLGAYRPSAGRRDLLAGLTVAALALPSGMAYAELAGLPPVAGLYALLLPTVAYALLGSSRQLIVGPEGALSAMIAASVLSLATAGSAEAAQLGAVLGLLVGALLSLRASPGWAGSPTTSRAPCWSATSTASPCCSSSLSSASSSESR